MAACSYCNLLQSTEPGLLPRTLLEPTLGWGGQESISALSPIQGLSLHSVESSSPAGILEFAYPVGEKTESHFPSSQAPAGFPLQCPLSASSLPAKDRLHPGEWGEIRARDGGCWNQTTSWLGGKLGTHQGFQLPCEYPNPTGVWQWWQENC